jgi:hypothetical protein
MLASAATALVMTATSVRYMVLLLQLGMLTSVRCSTGRPLLM